MRQPLFLVIYSFAFRKISIVQNAKFSILTGLIRNENEFGSMNVRTIVLDGNGKRDYNGTVKWFCGQ